MLDGLGSVNWSRLTHALGEASDVPEMIRALASRDEDERDRALDGLAGNIWHQGKIYESTAVAVPFLVELLTLPEVRDKAGILNLLANIAKGDSPEWGGPVRRAVEAGAMTYLGLLFHDDRSVRTFAAYLLGRCPGRAAEIVPVLAPRVSAEADASTRAAALLTLGDLGAIASEGQGGEAAAAVECLGPSAPPVVRLAAAIVLGKSAGGSGGEPSPEVVDAIIEAIVPAWDDFEDLPWCGGDVALDAISALSGHPREQLHVLLDLLDDPSEGPRAGALFALEALCRERRSVRPAAAVALGARLALGEPGERSEIAAALARLGPAAAGVAGSLADALEDDDRSVRVEAAVALARLRDPRAVPALIDVLLQGGRSFPRIAEALGLLGAEASAAVPPLVGILRRDPPADRTAAHNRPILVAMALGRIGEAARPFVPVLLDLAGDLPHTVRAVAIALGQIGGLEALAAIPHLEAWLEDADPVARVHAARALWRLQKRPGPVLPVLMDALRPEAPFRDVAAEALGEMGPAAARAVPALRECLDDRSPLGRRTRLEAARALWRIAGDVDGMRPVLIEYLDDQGPLAVTAAVTLGEMAENAREALPALRAAAAEDLLPPCPQAEDFVIQDEALRAALAEAIRRIEGDG
ncbi:HEAT repeat domain-containing protein [Aquisphaera insulae]|uniref:HEAT repeat domain-containing protein n=1 Tax=Aquisphaera insulae TaxID=2712864 RepID=UPI0013ED8255|nr:HEAT repeat domain-containing protein [Aquisphaera insulae]